jgi:hypothetical protein
MPLAALVGKCPEACAIGKSMVETTTGLFALERCFHGAGSSCSFVITRADASHELCDW